MSQSLSLFHRVRRPAQASDSPPMLILLHGYGSNENDLFGLAPYLDPRLFIVSVRAPHAMGGYGMASSWAWFNIGFTPAGLQVDMAQIEASRVLIAQFIEEVVNAYHVDAARVYLLGFSQGAMMSTAVTLTRPDLVAGAVLMSGWLPTDALLPFAPAEQLAGKPILALHGTRDPVLPLPLGRALRDTLAALPVSLTYREYPMAHEVSAASLADVAAWLAAQLEG